MKPLSPDDDDSPLPDVEEDDDLLPSSSEEKEVFRVVLPLLRLNVLGVNVSLLLLLLLLLDCGGVVSCGCGDDAVVVVVVGLNDIGDICGDICKEDELLFDRFEFIEAIEDDEALNDD